jgi:hypothetical protein
MMGQRAAMCVGRQRTADAVKELHTDGRLESAEGARQGWLGDVQPRGDASDVGVRHHGGEPAQFLHLHCPQMLYPHRFAVNDAFRGQTAAL